MLVRAAFILSLLAGMLAAGTAGAQSKAPLLFREPTVSQTQIVFVFAGDLWIVDRGGGDARRLTTHAGFEVGPIFSPDGATIAFTGIYDGNVDVFTVPSSGGVPKRLTYHPGSDSAEGWTPDGREILFRTTRKSFGWFGRFFTIPREGGVPREIMLPMGQSASFSPDGARLAYNPWGPQGSWKQYRGGTTPPVWIATLADSKIEKIPRNNSNDTSPMWIGEKVYFLSDRGGPVTLYSYDTRSKEVKRVIRNNGLDIKSASAGPDAIVFERFGEIRLFDVKSGEDRRVEIRLSGDLPEVRPRYTGVGNRIASFGVSPTGARAVFEGRGEILTVPAEKGDPRNLTNTPGVMERMPAWSPNGKWIAYFSDASGEYELHLKAQNGMGDPRVFKLGDAPSFYYSPVWSPDSRKIAYSDKRFKLWVLDIDKGVSSLVDEDKMGWSGTSYSWAPDSRWIAYTKSLKSRMQAVYLYEMETGRKHQITDGMSDAVSPVFDKNGKYLYFLASTDVGPAVNGFDMSSYNTIVTRVPYVIVLRKDLPSPLAPESDEEKVKEEDADKKDGDKKDEPKKEEDDKNGDKKDDDSRKDESKDDKKPDESKDDPSRDGEKSDSKDAGAKTGNDAKKPGGKDEKKDEKKDPEPVKIDLDGIDQRILSLPIPGRNYYVVVPGKAQMIYLLEGAPPGGFNFNGNILHKYDVEKRKFEKVMEGVATFDLSFDGEKMLYRQGSRWAITPIAAPKPAEGTLRVDAMQVRVVPQDEWKQMYHEAWRIQRDFFYDPGHHGLDLKAAEEQYAIYLPGLASRSDLNYLFSEMLGNMSVGHMYVGGGDGPSVGSVPGGLLGADYKVENDRYRFEKIYIGENWNPGLRSPLTEPGVNVKEGDYLLAVNGRDVRPPESVYSFFESTANRQVVIKVGPNPDGKDAREATVVPIYDEMSLRHRSWLEENRHKVEKMSGGRVGYVYLPDTGGGGYSYFNRYFFAQVGKEGAVIDERFNGGGHAANYIIDYLRRPLMAYWAQREGEPITTPTGAIFGPKAMIINQFAGSGGDLMPWMFRRAKIGPLIGKRTWGGLVGIGSAPGLMDGGGVTSPFFAFFTPEGEWEIENHGVDPDIEVDLDPESWRKGQDPQLEKAVEFVMAELKKNPPPSPKRPPYPVYKNGPRQASAD